MTSTEKIYDNTFFEHVGPTKLSESRQLKLNAIGWGILTDYYVESVKINRYKDEPVTSTVIKIADRAGQITCVIKGPIVGILFGLSPKLWKEIENLCNHGQQLFYRNFKEGLSRNFSVAQKMFYSFCSCNQKFDAVVAIFRRSVNVRNKDKNDAFLQILELRKCDNFMLDIYVNYLKQKTKQ